MVVGKLNLATVQRTKRHWKKIKNKTWGIKQCLDWINWHNKIVRLVCMQCMLVEEKKIINYLMIFN